MFLYRFGLLTAFCLLCAAPTFAAKRVFIVGVDRYDNLDGSATPARELLLMRARWLPLIGGRVDAVVLGGDVTAGHVLQANACIDGDLDSRFLVERDCSVGGGGAPPSCTVIKAEGSLSACAFGDELLPSEDPSDATLEPGAPENPQMPQAMPSP